MTTWNHRLVEMKDGDDTILGICEVFYDNDGKPLMRNEGARVFGENTEELRRVLDRMAGALEKPVLKDSDFAVQEPVPVTPEQEALYRGIAEHPGFTAEGAHKAFEVNPDHMRLVKRKATRPGIRLMPQDKVNEYAKEVALILEAIGHPEALVTDESTFWDFMVFEDAVQDTEAEGQRRMDALLKPLGVKGLCTPDTKLWEAAKLLRQRGVPT
jgi:hypothetical protein